MGVDSHSYGQGWRWWMVSWGWPSEVPELSVESRQINLSWAMGVDSHSYGQGWRWWMVCMRDKASGGWSHAGRCRSTCRVRGDTLMTPDHIVVRSFGYGPAGIGRSSGKGLSMGLREKVPINCPCSRLAALHGALRTQLLFLNKQPLTAYPGCEIPGRSGFAFNNSKDLRGWSQSGRVWVAGLLGGGSEDKPSVQLFVVENCSGRETVSDTPFRWHLRSQASFSCELCCVCLHWRSRPSFTRQAHAPSWQQQRDATAWPTFE